MYLLLCRFIVIVVGLHQVSKSALIKIISCGKAKANNKQQRLWRLPTLDSGLRLVAAATAKRRPHCPGNDKTRPKKRRNPNQTKGDKTKRSEGSSRRQWLDRVEVYEVWSAGCGVRDTALGRANHLLWLSLRFVPHLPHYQLCALISDKPTLKAASPKR